MRVNVFYIDVASCHSARYRCNGNEFQYVHALKCAHVFNYFFCLRFDWSMNILWIKKFRIKAEHRQRQKNEEHCRARFVCSLPCCSCCHIMKLAFPFVVTERQYYHFIAATLSHCSLSFHIPKIKETRKMHLDFIFLLVHCDSVDWIQTKMRLFFKWCSASDEQV